MTAYGWRISDWSSDVCSSDLTQNQDHGHVPVSSQASGQVPSPDSRFHGRPRVRSVPGGPSGARSAQPPGAPASPAQRQLRIRPLAAADVPRDLIGPSRHASSNQGAKGGNVAAIMQSATRRSEEHTSELQSLMRISYAVFCLKNKQHHLI